MNDLPKSVHRSTRPFRGYNYTYWFDEEHNLHVVKKHKVLNSNTSNNIRRFLDVNGNNKETSRVSFGKWTRETGNNPNVRTSTRDRGEIGYDTEVFRETEKSRQADDKRYNNVNDDIQLKFQKWHGESSKDYASEAKDRSKEIVKLKAENAALA